MFFACDSPGATDRAIRRLVALGLPGGVKIVSVVMFAESWSNDTAEVLARQALGENFSLEGLPGTFDIISLILDSPSVQGMWTNRLRGTIGARSLGEWQEMKEMRYSRFANYFRPLATRTWYPGT